MVSAGAIAAKLAIGVALAPTPDANQVFQAADKGAYTLFDEPLQRDAPTKDVFPYNDGIRDWLPPRFLAPDVIGSAPIPTNNWWGNMIHPASTAASAQTDPMVESIWTNPYVFRPVLNNAPFGLSVDYPNRYIGGSSDHGSLTYGANFSTDFTISAAEFLLQPDLQVTGWDDLGVSLRFSSLLGGQVVTTLVPGMAIVTAKYTNLTPRLVANSTITSVNDCQDFFLKGKRFVIKLASGQKWVLYTSTETTLLFDGFQSLTGEAFYTGHYRLALVVSDTQLAALDKSASCLLEGSNIEAKDASHYMFHLKTSGDCSNGLFHYLQVHHMDTLDRSSAEQVKDSTARSATRGPMTGVLTKTNPPVIRFEETQNVPVDFYPPRTPRADIIKNQGIKEYLLEDINATWSIPVDGSYYFNGKAIHMYANLCLLANNVAITGDDKKQILRTCLDKLETVLQPFITNTWVHPLNYDTTYRGMVSPLGLINNDILADFGNTMYNDHHYHFGYWIAASAIVNYLDPTWSGIPQLNRVAMLLIRDVANPSNSDQHFPKFRSLDWFRGHSYSHGVTSVPDGKDEESVSEDINFHYAVALFGKATGNTRLATIGQLLLKLNTRAAQNYFLLTNDNRVHPPSIVSNKVTGIMWDNKVTYTTWFTQEAYGIHGIQMIPITPVTEYVRTPKFISEEWDAIVSKIPDVQNTTLTNSWLSLIYANYATINMELALEKLQVVSLDNGITRSWALFIAASSASPLTPPVDATRAPKTPSPTTMAPNATTPTPSPTVSPTTLVPNGTIPSVTTLSPVTLLPVTPSPNPSPSPTTPEPTTPVPSGGPSKPTPAPTTKEGKITQVTILV